LNGTENTYWFDVTGATSWTPEKLNDANFRVRVDAYTVGDAGEVRLDWIAVEVTYYVVPKFRILWRTHDTDYESDDITPTDVFADYYETRTVNPYTGSAWTWDEVNNLQVGARASALTGDDNIKVSEFWVEVVYTPQVTVDITLSKVPISWGTLNPGTENNPALENQGFPMAITVESTTNVNVDIYLKGTNWENGTNVIGVENCRYDSDDNLANGGWMTLKTSYVSPIFENVAPGAVKYVYFWISVPANQWSGYYTSTVSVKAVKTGEPP
jgi:hypothetical protein